MTNWTTPSSNDLAKVIANSIFAAQNENIDSDTIESAMLDPDQTQTFNPDLMDRATALLNEAVNQFRGAIQIASKYPLSLTAGSVPPEVNLHVLNFAAYQLVVSIPSLKMFILTEKGTSSPFATFYREATQYLEMLRKGRNITFPTDPTGQDYINPVNIPWCGASVSPYPAYDSTKPINPPLRPVRVGGSSPPSDMNSFQGYFEQEAPFGFPVDNIGQP